MRLSLKHSGRGPDETLLYWSTNWFARKDSNLDFQGQNLTCCHYTTGEYVTDIRAETIIKPGAGTNCETRE